MRNQQYKQFNCYTALEIPPTAMPHEIKSARNKMSRKTHADLGGSHDAQVKVNLAYEILSDPIQRQAHDLFWKILNETIAQPLAAFKKKLEQTIHANKVAAWGKLAERKKEKLNALLKQLHAERIAFYQLTAATIVSAFIGMRFPLLLLAAGWLGYIAFGKLKGVTLQQQKFHLFGVGTAQAVHQHAEALADKQCKDEAGGYDQNMAHFAAMMELASQSSSYDDSEEHVVRRIATALFIMGYTPSQYDNELRTLLLTDGDEKLVVRFRHRAGPAINITYVERLQALMSIHKASHGMLFCSPGLSGNAAQYAAQHGIKWYTLESMNTWIDSILRSDYAGPTGDMLVNLGNLNRFLAGITHKVGHPYSRSGHYRSRRRRRY